MDVPGFTQDGDKYPDWPSDLDTQPSDAAFWEAAVDSARSYGNEYFKVIIGTHFIKVKLANIFIFYCFLVLFPSFVSFSSPAFAVVERVFVVIEPLVTLSTCFEAERGLQDRTKKVSEGSTVPGCMLGEGGA